MSRDIFLDASPPVYRGAEGTLDRSAFHKSIDVLAARTIPAKIGSLLKAEALKRFIPNAHMGGVT
jgi:tRNA (guanine37-N1)-methyltransferase